MVSAVWEVWSVLKSKTPNQHSLKQNLLRKGTALACQMYNIEWMWLPSSVSTVQRGYQKISCFFSPKYALDEKILNSVPIWFVHIMITCLYQVGEYWWRGSDHNEYSNDCTWRKATFSDTYWCSRSHRSNSAEYRVTLLAYHLSAEFHQNWSGCSDDICENVFDIHYCL